MKRVTDFQGRRIRITDERMVHILEHPEMAGLESAIEETLTHPQIVVQSRSDEQAELYTALTRQPALGTNSSAPSSRWPPRTPSLLERVKKSRAT